MKAIGFDLSGRFRDVKSRAAGIIFLAAVMMGAVQGCADASIYKFHTDSSVCYEMPAKITGTSGPRLFFSDSPEFVADCGIMYRDTLSGDVRIFFDHINASSEDRKIGVVIRNLSDKPVEVTKKQSGISSVKDWNAIFAASKNYQASYFASKLNEKFTLPAGVSYEVISRGGGGAPICAQGLFTGMADFHFSAPVEITAIMVHADEDIERACGTYGVLAPDAGEFVLRGTFPYSEIRVDVQRPLVPALGKVCTVVLGSRKNGGYVKGVDATRGEQVTDYGNYGAIYTVKFKVKCARNKAALIMLNPLGGPVGGAAKISCGGKTNLIYIPKEKQAVGKDTLDEKYLLARVRGSADVTFTFAPSSGSFLPVKLMVYSEDEFLRETSGKKAKSSKSK